MSKKSTSLSDTIAGLLHTAPTFEPEEETNVETRARVVEKEDLEGDEDDVDNLFPSKFRRQNATLLDEEDPRYAGKGGSRKNLRGSDSESDDSVGGDGFEEEDSDEIGDEEEDDELDDEEEDDELDDEEETGERSDDGGDYKRDDDGEGNHLEDNRKHDSKFKHLKDENKSAETNKGICVRNQLNIWEHLVEMRIQLQKCLIASNKFPQHTTYKEFKENDEFTSKVAKTKDTLSNTLRKLIELQSLCINKFPDTKKLLKGGAKPNKKIRNDDDEEIPSDTDPEPESDERNEDEAPPKKKQKMNLKTEVQTMFDAYTPYRNTTIQKWNEKTRIASGKKSTTPANSALNQINFILNDKPRLIKRTQLKRSEYKIIGVEEEEPPADVTDDNTQQEVYNSEIFDDDDFYHTLLRELIEAKSAAVTDPAELNRQWVRLQSLRQKMKKKVDTRATKGRKIRYVVHQKLVNLMGPIDEQHWTEEAKTELFGSLFGKCK